MARSDSARHRARILEVADEVLRRDPRAGLAAIADAAGLTRTTMYAHFPSRGALVEAVVASAIDAAAAEWDAREPRPSAAAELADQLRASWQLFARHGGLSVAGIDALGAERAEQLHEPLRKRIRDLVDRGRAEGAFDPVADPDWLVRVWFALVHAAGDRVRATPADLDAVTDDLTTAIHRAWSRP